MAADAEVRLKVTGEDAGGTEVLEDVGDAAREAKKDVDRLGDSEGLEELARDAEDSVKAFKKAERAFESAVDKFRTAEFSPAFDEGSKAAQRLRQEVVKTGRRLNDLAKGVPPELRKIGRGFEDVEKRVRAARAAITRFQKGARRIDSVLKSVTSLRTAVGALQVAFVAAIGQRFIAALVRTSTEAVKLKASLDLIRPALKANLGSTDAAAEGYEFLERTSDRLKVTINSLATNYVQLTAATKGTVIEGETTNRLFESITAAGRALGKSNEDISRAFLGLSQAAGGANVQMQEVRQITEAIPGLFAAWAKELGRTQGELRTLISTAQVTADQLETLADAAERLEGGAVAEQLKTIAGQMQALEVASQAAQVALADGLEPGLKKLFGTLLENQDTVKAVAGVLGTQLSKELTDVNSLLVATEIAARIAFIHLEELGTLGDVITEGLGLSEFREELEGIPEAAKEAFDAIESGAVSAAGAVEDGSDAVEIAAESFGQLPEAAKKAFQQIATAAGIDAKTRKKIALDLADDVSEITEKSVRLRAELEKIVLEAARQGGQEEIEVRREVAEAEKRIAEEAIQATREAIAERLRAARTAAAEEKKLTEALKTEFLDRVSAAENAASDEVASRTEAAKSIIALEQRQTKELEKIWQERLKAFEASDDKRVKLLEENDKKILAFAEKSATDRIALEEKLLEAARKASEEKIKLAQKEADEIIAANDRVRAAAEAGGEKGEDGEPTTEGDALAQTAAGVTKITETLEQLRAELDRLQFGDVPVALRAEKVLAASQAYTEARLGIAAFGQASTAAGQEASAAQEEIQARAEATLEAILTELQARKDLSTAQVDGAQAFTEALSLNIETLTLLSEAGIVTDEDIKRLAETWAAYNGQATGETVPASQAIQEALAAQQEQAKELAKATDDLTKAHESEIKVIKDAEGKVTGLQTVRKKLTEEEEAAVEPTEEAAAAIKAEGEAADQAGQPVQTLATATDRLGDASERAGVGLQTVKDEATLVSEVEPPDRLVESFSNLAGIMPGLRSDIREVRDALQEIVDLEPGILRTANAVGELSGNLGEAAAEASNLAAALAEVGNNEAGI